MVVIREPKPFYYDFHLSKDVDKNLKHEIEFIIKYNKSLAENKIKKTRFNNYWSNISMETIFRSTENSKTNELHKFFPNLQTLDLGSSYIHVALENVSIYYTWKDIRKQYENNKLKIIAPTWNDEFELPDASYSVSDIWDYIEYIKNTKQ